MILHTDTVITGLIIRFPRWVIRLYCKHPGKIFDKPITVGERNRGNKSRAHCSACGKDLGNI